MAYSKAYNKFLFDLVNGDHDLDSADTYKCLLVDDTYTFDTTHDYVADVAGDEVSGGSYARQTLSTKAITNDTTNSRVIWKCDDITFTAVDAGTVAAAIIFKFVTNDADSPLCLFIDLGTIATDGSDLELVVDTTEGIWQSLAG